MPARSSPRRIAPIAGAIALIVLVVVVLGGTAVATNAFGMGDRAEAVARRIDLFLNPPPDRPIDAEEEVVTPEPGGVGDAEGDDGTGTAASPAAAGSPGPGGTGAPPPTGIPAGSTPAPGRTPVPERTAVDVNIDTDPAAHFISEVDHEWCAVAGTQMVLAAHGKAPLTKAFQKELAGRIGEWESRRDSKNGDWGPAAIARALAAYGVPGYKVRVYDTRQQALRDAARAIERTQAPVLLLTWRGAHTWVMTGFKADADPAIFDDAKVSGTYILDPWYPRVSSIWGPSDPPGTFQDAAEMKRNYLPWKRPEGIYPSRDGKFVAVVPTEPAAP